MTAPYKLVDAFLQLPQLSRRAQEQKIDPNIAKWFKPGDAVKFGFTLDELLRDMEAADVEKGVLTAAAAPCDGSNVQFESLASARAG